MQNNEWLQGIIGEVQGYINEVKQGAESVGQDASFLDLGTGLLNPFDKSNEAMLKNKKYEDNDNYKDTFEGLSMSFFETDSSVSSKIITIDNFINVVKEYEQLYSKEKATRGKANDLLYMITQFRKSFYNNAGWNNHLIPARKNIKLEIKMPEITKNQVVKLYSGHLIDMGHVFAGLDALFYPPVKVGFFWLSIRRNYDAATWVGDLGSVVGECYLKGLLSKKNQVEIQSMITKFASPKDMLGNIDSFSIFNMLREQNQGITVSYFLERYYMATNFYSNQRFKKFVEELGINEIIKKDLNKLDKKNTPSELNQIAEDIADSAGLYTADKEYEWAVPQASEAQLVSRYSYSFAKELLILFLKTLKSEIDD